SDHHDLTVGPDDQVRALTGLVEQRLAAEQATELLGASIAGETLGERAKAGAVATSEDDRPGQLRGQGHTCPPRSTAVKQDQGVSNIGAGWSYCDPHVGRKKFPHPGQKSAATRARDTIARRQAAPARRGNPRRRGDLMTKDVAVVHHADRRLDVVMPYAPALVVRRGNLVFL